MKGNGEKGKEEIGKASYGLVNFERRRYPRFSIDLPIEYYRLNLKEKRQGRAGNISEGGLMVYFPERMDIGQQLRIKVFFPNEAKLVSLELVGEVVWVDIPLGNEVEPRCGLKFIEVSPEDLKRLRDFLNNLTKI